MCVCVCVKESVYVSVCVCVFVGRSGWRVDETPGKTLSCVCVCVCVCVCGRCYRVNTHTLIINHCMRVCVCVCVCNTGGQTDRDEGYLRSVCVNLRAPHRKQFSQLV